MTQRRFIDLQTIIVSAFISMVLAQASIAADLEIFDSMIERRAYTEASLWIDEQLAIAPASEALLYRKALCEFHLKRYGLAYSITRELLNIRSDEISYHNLGGSICLRAGDYPRALAHFHRSLKRNPQDADVWVNFSYAMRRSIYGSSGPYLERMNAEFGNNLGGSIVLAEFAQANGKPSKFLELARAGVSGALPAPFLRRFSLLAREMSDLPLDIALLENLQRQQPNDPALAEELARMKAAEATVKELALEKRETKALSSSINGSQNATTHSRSMPSLPDAPLLVTPDRPMEAMISEYYLPFPFGQARFCVQSVDGEASHQGRSRFAIDFFAKPGTLIVSSRSGTVTKVRESGEPMDNTDYATFVEVLHSDGERSRYFHLAPDSIKVSQGQRVARGQPLGAAGQTAISKLGILHFDVVERAGFPGLRDAPPYRLWKSIPVKFNDLSHLREEAGCPIEGRWYVSQNTPMDK